MDRKRWFIIWGAVALLVFGPPALLLFGRWDRETKRDRANREAFDRPIPTPISSPSARFVPAGETPGELKRFGQGTLIRALAVSPDGRTVVAGSSDNNLRTWTLDGNTSTTYGIGYPQMNALAYAPDAHRVLAGPNGVPVLWDQRTGQVQYVQAGMADNIQCLAIAPNGITAVTGSSSRTVRVWNLETAAEIGVIGTHGDGGVIAVAYSADGKRLHSASDTGEICVWDLKSGDTLTGRHYYRPWRKAAFSTDGKLLLVGAPDGRVWVYDVHEQGQQRLHVQAHRAGITGVAFSPDASRFATASGTDLALWETATGEQISTMRLPHQQHINGAMTLLSTNRHVLFGGNGISLVLMPPDDSASPPSRPEQK
jgi:WD40 repeat protein